MLKRVPSLDRGSPQSNNLSGPPVRRVTTYHPLSKLGRIADHVSMMRPRGPLCVHAPPPSRPGSSPDRHHQHVLIQFAKNPSPTGTITMPSPAKHLGQVAAPTRTRITMYRWPEPDSHFLDNVMDLRLLSLFLLKKEQLCHFNPVLKLGAKNYNDAI